jgi:hypothetical protein
MPKNKANIDKLVNEFLGKARIYQADVELLRVLKARVYQIAQANVLIRAASEGNKRYFFGINYITIEEIANLDNPFIAFICGSLNRTIIIPAKILFKHLSEISHDRNGEYKISIDNNLDIVLSGRGNRLKCTSFINSWELLLKPYEGNIINNTPEESLHSILQGRLLEIGNIRGYKSYCPDKSRFFNTRQLSDIASLSLCPRLEFADYNTLRNIDVLWFTERNDYYIPEYAFEIELSTGTWSGVGRMATLIDYRHVNMYVISNNLKKYSQVMHSFADYFDRYKHISVDSLGDLYSAELHLKELRYKIGL